MGRSDCVASPEKARASRESGKKEVVGARVHARRPHALPTGLGSKTTGEVEVGWASELGRLQGRAR